MAHYLINPETGLLSASVAGSETCDVCGKRMTPENARYGIANDGMGFPTVVLAGCSGCVPGENVEQAAKRLGGEA